MTEITVMSFNTGMLPTMNLPSGKKEFETVRGRKPKNTFLQEEDIPMIGRILRAHPHDIYALQEVWTPELLEGLRQELGKEYMGFFPENSRRGLLNAKYTAGIVNRELADKAGFIYSTVDGYDRIPSFKVSTEDFDVYGIHLRAAFTGPAKVRELGGVIEDANKNNDGRPQLIIGDFNLFEGSNGENVVAKKINDKFPRISYGTINSVIQIAAQDGRIKAMVEDFEDLGSLVEGSPQITTFQGLPMRPTRAYIRNMQSRTVDYRVLDKVYNDVKGRIFQDHFPVSVTLTL